MKSFHLSVRATLAALLLAFVGSASAAPQTEATRRPPGGLTCSAMYSTCMFNGVSAHVCSVRYDDCRNNRPGTILQPLVSPLPEVVDAEANARRFEALLVADARSPSRFGSTYCLKMLYRCDAGDASACVLFERNCNP